MSSCSGPNGEPFTDESGRVTFFVCGPKKRAKPCAFCGKTSTRLCDGKWVSEGKKTSCDKPICEAHRTVLPGDRDYCPDCEKRTRVPMTPVEVERNECLLLALHVAAEAKTEQGGNAAREIARRIRERISK